MAVDFDDSAVDHRELHVGIVGDRLEQALEDVELHPVSEPLEHRVPVAEPLGQIAPRRAGARDPQHRLDKPAGIAARSARIAGPPETMRLHPRPLHIRQHRSGHSLLPRSEV